MHVTTAIDIRNLTVVYNSLSVLTDITVSISPGLLLAIAGPNGGGKTTLIKTVLGLVQPVSGTIAIFDETLEKNRQSIAYIPQRFCVDWDFPVTVLDVVLMGRYRHIGWFARPQQKDYDRAHYALTQVQLSQYADRHISQLSGGQQQRVFLARALAQEAEIYLLDEPFIGLDIPTENIIIEQLQSLRNQGKTVIVVHHDLQTLAAYFDWVLLLNNRKIAFGPVKQTCIPEYICAAYGERASCMQGIL